MKKIIILLLACIIGSGAFAKPSGDIDKKLVQSFKTLFPNAREVKWYENTDTYQVFFVESEIKTRITYQKDGYFVQFLRYYQEQNLPSYIQYRIKQEYPGKTIFGITELSTISGPEKTVKVEYNLKLVDEKNWIIVILDTDGNLKTVQKLKKAY